MKEFFKRHLKIMLILAFYIGGFVSYLLNDLSMISESCRSINVSLSKTQVLNIVMYRAPLWPWYVIRGFFQ
jgi:hypothetical protein